MGIALLESTLNAVTNRLSLFRFHPVLLINYQITIGVQYGALANIARNLSQRYTTSTHRHLLFLKSGASPDIYRFLL